MIDKTIFETYGFKLEQCNITKEFSYKYDCDEYHITVSTELYGPNYDARHTCHIDGSDFSTIGFAYVKTIEDVNLLLTCTGETPLKHK